MLDMNTTLPMVDIIGYLAALCMVCGYMPQAIYTIRTRNTDSIALPTFLLMGFGALFFVIQGAMTDNLPLVITNLITSACCVIITSIKVYNKHFRRK